VQLFRVFISVFIPFTGEPHLDHSAVWGVWLSTTPRYLRRFYRLFSRWNTARWDSRALSAWCVVKKPICVQPFVPSTWAELPQPGWCCWCDYFELNGPNGMEPRTYILVHYVCRAHIHKLTSLTMAATANEAFSRRTPDKNAFLKALPASQMEWPHSLAFYL